MGIMSNKLGKIKWNQAEEFMFYKRDNRLHKSFLIGSITWEHFCCMEIFFDSFIEDGSEMEENGGRETNKKVVETGWVRVDEILNHCYGHMNEEKWRDGTPMGFFRGGMPWMKN